MVGFIEKMLGARMPAADAAPQGEENTAQATQTAEDAAQQTTVPTSKDTQSENDIAQPVSYTATELEQLIDSRKKEWLKEQELNQAEYFANLSEADRLKAQGFTKDSEIARLKSELEKRDMEDKVISMLEQSGFPISLAKFVKYGDNETTAQNTQTLISVFGEMLANEVNNRLRGRTPEGLGRAGRNLITGDAFSDKFKSSFMK